MAAEPSEYQIKAAFIYNVTKFIEWPSDDSGQSGETINLCILGSDPFGSDIASIEEKSAKGKSFKIFRYGKMEKTMTPSQCQLLFISRSEEKILSDVLHFFRGGKTLTVSDIEGFTESGGMVGFINKLEDKGVTGFAVKKTKIGISINPEAAKQSGFKISSKLLKLAEISGN